MIVTIRDQLYYYRVWAVVTLIIMLCNNYVPSEMRLSCHDWWTLWLFHVLGEWKNTLNLVKKSFPHYSLATNYNRTRMHRALAPCTCTASLHSLYESNAQSDFDKISSVQTYEWKAPYSITSFSTKYCSGFKIIANLSYITVRGSKKILRARRARQQIVWECIVQLKKSLPLYFSLICGILIHWLRHHAVFCISKEL